MKIWEVELALAQRNTIDNASAVVFRPPLHIEVEEQLRVKRRPFEAFPAIAVAIPDSVTRSSAEYASESASAPQVSMIECPWLRPHVAASGDSVCRSIAAACHPTSRHEPRGLRKTSTQAGARPIGGE
jgi:hypothetical protein